MEDCIVACLTGVQGLKSYAHSRKCERWIRVWVLLAEMVLIVRLAASSGCCEDYDIFERF